MHWQDSQTFSDFRSGPFPLPRLFFLRMILPRLSSRAFSVRQNQVAGCGNKESFGGEKCWEAQLRRYFSRTKGHPELYGCGGGSTFAATRRGGNPVGAGSAGEKGRGKAGKGPGRNPEKQQMGRYVRDCRGKPAAGRGLAAESPT